MAYTAIFEKKNILVIGGAGFIGSHLCDELVKNNKVICLDNFSTGDEKNIDHLLADENFEFINHDISDPINLEELPELEKFKIRFQGIQEIYNLACPTSPLEFEKNIIRTLDANSVGLRNALNLAVKNQAKFLHFSSSVVYGPRQNDIRYIKENYSGSVDALSLRGAYDEGKRFSETMVKNFGDFYKIDTKIIRLFRVYGPRMKLLQGHMIPDFISSALENNDLEIFGNEDFSTSFCYVSDCIDAAIKMMNSDLREPINIGSDVDIKIKVIAEMIISILSSGSKLKFLPEHFFITPLSLPDITRAKDDLGWIPVTTLERGLAATIHDLRASMKLKTLKNLS
jgi:nucleoside-diphosphate-sugar epimerase